jgi:geranylgeranylglycerol-phosphate geranylgeranyltransferase
MQLLRLQYSLPFVWPFALTVWYASGGDLSGRFASLAWACGALVSLLCGTYCLNDVLDVRFDAINAPQRPICSGRISRKTGVLAAAGFVPAALGFAFLAGGIFPIAICALGAALVGYDCLSKRLGPAKPFVASVLVTALYPLALAQAGGVVGPRAGGLYCFAAWMFLTVCGYELFKDIRDRRGDGRGPLNVKRYWTLGNITIVLGAVALLPAGVLGMSSAYAPAVFILVFPPAAWAILTRRLRCKFIAVYVEFLAMGIITTLDPLVFGF